MFDLTKGSLRLLQRTSMQTNPHEPGRVIHELTTTGVVFNSGNLVEAPAYVRAVHHCWLWTGDTAFLREQYPFCKQALLDYTLAACDPDGDLCGAGRSIIETPEMHAGFECIDVATYTWEALLALAEARYGRLEQALRYTRKLAEALAVRTPGAISEALPDQWCFLQLWSALGIISPIVEGIFDIAPRAAERRLRVTANLPAGWTQAELRRVRIGDAFADLRAEQDGPVDAIRERRLLVTCSDPDYTLEIGCAIPDGAGVAEVWVNGQSASASAQPTEWWLEQTRVGQRVVCRMRGSGALVVRLR